MAEILIQGMEMPKQMESPITITIFKNGSIWMNDVTFGKGKMPNAKAIEVPTHGDWHTGKPTEEGDYLVKLDVEHHVYPYYVLKWNKGGWYSHYDMDYPACPQHSVLKWQKIEE